MKKGFTLVEILIAIALVVVIGALAILVLDPSAQLARGRNAARISHLNTILNAIWQNKSDNEGDFNCISGEIPTNEQKMATGTEDYNIAPCLVPVYLPTMPFDPNAVGAYYSSTTDYDTAYIVVLNATSGRVTVSAPYAELQETISVTR